MNFVIGGILECFGIAKRNSRIVCFLFIVFLGVLFCGNTSTPDRDGYVFLYNNFSRLELRGAYELGFQLLMLIGKKLGLSALLFCGGVCVISLSLLANAVIRLTDNPALAFCAYFLFPFVLNGEQLRSFIGMTIVLQGILCVLEKKRYGWYLYFFSCMIGGLFHISCFIYLLYLGIIIPKKMIKWIAAGVLLLFGVFRMQLIAIGKLILSIGANKLSLYLGEVHSKGNWVVYVGYYVLIIIVTLHFIKKHMFALAEREHTYSGNIVYKINIISLGFLILIYLNPNLERILHFILILDYCVLSNLIGKKIKYYWEIAVVVFLIVVPGARFMTYMFGSGYEVYIVPYFVNGFGSGG